MLGTGHNSLMIEYLPHRFFSVKGYHLPKTLGHLLKPLPWWHGLIRMTAMKRTATLLTLSRVNGCQP